MLRDQPRKVGLADDLVTVHGDDHIASGRRSQALELDLLSARLETRVGGWAFIADLGHKGAGVGLQAEPIGELRVERLGCDADVRVLDRAAGTELVDGARDEGDRDGEPDSLVAAGGRVDLLIDPDHAALGVEQGTARVAGIDGCVRLDRTVNLKLSQGLDRAVRGRDDPDRERSILSERAADRRHRLSDLDLLVGRQLEGAQIEALRVDLEQRDVGVGVEADDLGRHLVAVGELDVDLLRLLDRAAPSRSVGDHVGIGNDLTVVGDDEARSLRRRSASLQQAGATAGENRADRDHPRGRLLVDGLGIEGAPARLDHDGLLRVVGGGGGALGTG